MTQDQINELNYNVDRIANVLEDFLKLLSEEAERYKDDQDI